MIAESNDTMVVEGNHYFSPDALKREYFEPSTHSTVCGWKGVANYSDVVVNGRRNANAAWYYAEPNPRAAEIAHRVAFWRGVTISA